MVDKERVCIFIDGSNFYHSLKGTLGFHENKMDFQKLVNILKKDKMLIGVYYYNAPLDREYNKEVYSKQQKFFAELGRIPGFNVILCTLRKRKDADGVVKYSMKGDDIHLATDMISFAYENVYDTAVLVSGDGDFVPAIKRVQKLNKKVENAYFKISRSSYLKSVCTSSTCLDSLIQECFKKQR